MMGSFMVRPLLYGLCLFFFSSCSRSEKTELINPTYFDIKSYFINEASSLSVGKSLVLKEVNRNGEKEVKNILIQDWEKEFDLFIQSDINKPSWTSSYKVENLGDTTIYNALTPNLRTRVIQIIKTNNEINSILIKNESLNKLYKSYEYLTYYPDSTYIIEKVQQVRFLGENNYKIIGTFNN
jgi:hypothetical protein